MPASPVRLAVLGAAVTVGVYAGIQLGNSAIADINPIHYRGAVLHPRERGAAVPDQPVRPAAPTYAALYGWDEGRAALAAERDRYDAPVAAAPPPIAAPPRRRAVAQSWDAPPEPRRFRASVRDNEVRVHRGDYQSRDVYLPRNDGAAGDRSEDKPEALD
jgi:hypothetical protein